MDNGWCYETTLGKMVMTENGQGITRLFFSEKMPDGITIKETLLLKQGARELKEYLAGKRRRFDLPLLPRGTDFQQKVWGALLTIPYGAVCSYKDIAIAIGNEKACRAVGGANNKNPIAIMIPCHRVIGADGRLVGYAGGLGIKEQLLKLERK